MAGCGSVPLSSTPPPLRPSAQSIMKALDNFMRAANQMSEVVMVPNKLKDIDVLPALAPSPSKVSSFLTPMPTTVLRIETWGRVLNPSRNGGGNAFQKCW